MKMMMTPKKQLKTRRSYGRAYRQSPLSRTTVRYPLSLMGVSSPWMMSTPGKIIPMRRDVVLQQGRGHAFAEEFAAKPPSISPKLQWWLDRIRGGEEDIRLPPVRSVAGPSGVDAL